MKKILIILMSLLCIAGCSGVEAENTQFTGDGFLKSFNLKYLNEGTFHGRIKDGTITVGGIEYGLYVTGADVRLADGAVIDPDPASLVGKWPQDQSFTVTLPDGRNRVYTVHLTSYLGNRPEEEGGGRSGQVVIGYLIADDHQYDELFSSLDWDALTHVIPSFCYIRSDGSLDSRKMDKHLTEIRDVAHSHGVKVLASFNTASKGQFETAIQTPESRKKVADNIVDYIVSNGLDGADIDYEEYSNLNSNVPNLLDLFQRIRNGMDKGMVLSCAINSATWLDYGISWHQNFDYVHLMIYDALNTDDPRPVQHASFDKFVECIEYARTEYQIPDAKIVAGLPFYGYTWDSGKAQSIRFGSIVKDNPGNPDVVEGDQIGKTLYNGKATIRKKTQYVMDKNLGGVMIWQLFHDAIRPEDRLLGEIGRVIGTSGEKDD